MTQNHFPSKHSSQLQEVICLAHSWSNLIFGSNTGFCQHNKYKIALIQHTTLLLLQQREWQLTLACLSDCTLFQWTLSFSGSFFTGACTSVCLSAFEIMLYNLSQSFLRTHLGVEAQGRRFNSLGICTLVLFVCFVLLCFFFFSSIAERRSFIFLYFIKRVNRIFLKKSIKWLINGRIYEVLMHDMTSSSTGDPVAFQNKHDRLHSKFSP